MKSIGTDLLRLDSFPSGNHMREMQNQIVRNLIFQPEITKTVIQICVHNPAQNIPILKSLNHNLISS